MRMGVFALAAAQIGLLIAMTARGVGTDSAGNAMSTGLVTLAGLLMAVFLAPALILAINRKAPGMALALSLLSLAAVILVLITA